MIHRIDGVIVQTGGAGYKEFSDAIEESLIDVVIEELRKSNKPINNGKRIPGKNKRYHS